LSFFSVTYRNCSIPNGRGDHGKSIIVRRKNVWRSFHSIQSNWRSILLQASTRWPEKLSASVPLRNISLVHPSTPNGGDLHGRRGCQHLRHLEARQRGEKWTGFMLGGTKPMVGLRMLKERRMTMHNQLIIFNFFLFSKTVAASHVHHESIAALLL
jgi:hypothetical protein